MVWRDESGEYNMWIYAISYRRPVPRAQGGIWAVQEKHYNSSQVTACRNG
jgi:hypothetical protein